MTILSWSQKNDPARIVVENFAIRIKIFLMVLNYQKSGFTSKSTVWLELNICIR